MKCRILFVFFLLLSFSLRGQSPVQESLFTDKYTIDPENEGTLGLSIDNLNFFKNNEFDGDIVAGYSAPGFRLAPHLVFQPTSLVKLEAGLSLLKYWGAEKYPNYAYSDIVEWKADHYQWGFHLLPFFRAQIQPTPQINVVLGNIYGGDNHGLIDPLYNSELNMTADPEVGAQILYNSRIAHFDTWINWESFTFKNENHNEAFTVGSSLAFHITDPKSSFYLGLPAQIIVTHRGGEIDAVSGNVRSYANYAAGLRFGYNIDHSFFRQVTAEVMGVGYQPFMDGDNYLPYDKGWGLHSKLNFQLWNVNLKFLYWRAGDFVSLLGNPIFGSISMTHEGRVFSHVSVINPGFRYEQKFGSGYYLGADFECFYNPKLYQYRNDEFLTEIKSGFSYNWSMGVYLRINPSIILKKY